MDKLNILKEKCGICAVINSKELKETLYNSMLALQHRGQESAGIAFFDPQQKRSFVLKTMGLVHGLFYQHVDKIKGFTGIGHLRYSTSGVSTLEEAQPMEINNVFIAFNGNLTNYKTIRRKYSDAYDFKTETDTEVLGYMVSKAINESKSTEEIFDLLKKYLGEITGAYSLVALDKKGRTIIVRDPYGFKPLAMGKKDDSLIFASESVALTSCGYVFVRDIEPGEAVVIDTDNQYTSKIILESKKRTFCMFEFVYFARPDSVLEGRNVELVREELGKALGREAINKKIDFDIIVPVPDSGRSAAQGMAEITKKPLKEALIKNRYVHRTFIMPGDDNRKKLIELKMNAIKELLEGKRIALVDDSIVRGNTMKKLVTLIRKNGAKEIHLFISCPKIIAPCFMGIDFPTYTELIGSTKSVEEIREFLGVDTLTYISIEDLENAISLRKRLCMACLTNKYPIYVEPEAFAWAKQTPLERNKQKKSYGCC